VLPTGRHVFSGLGLTLKEKFRVVCIAYLDDEKKSKKSVDALHISWNWELQ